MIGNFRGGSFWGGGAAGSGYVRRRALAAKFKIDKGYGLSMKKIIALVLMGIAALLLILNVGMIDGVTLNLVVTKIHASISVVLLAAIAFGVLIGILIK